MANAVPMIRQRIMCAGVSRARAYCSENAALHRPRGASHARAYWSHSAGLSELIDKATHVESHPDKRGRNDVKAVHTFSVKAKMGMRRLTLGLSCAS